MYAKLSISDYAQAIKIELAKYKVKELKNIAKAFNQRKRILITGKTKSQLIDEIADRLLFLLQIKYKAAGLEDDLFNAAAPYITKGIDAIGQAVKNTYENTIGSLPGMQALQHLI